MHRQLFMGLCALGLLTFASCSESMHPISAIEDAERDERLVGVWIAETNDRKEGDKPDGAAYLHIGAEAKRPLSPQRKKPEPALMAFVWVEHKNDNNHTTLAPISGRFFTSKIGDERYANVFCEWNDEKRSDENKPPQEPSYKFMGYLVDGDRLTIWFADDEPFEKAVKEGALAGKIVRKGGRFKIDTAELTATSEALTAFVKTDAGKKAFQREGPDGKLTFRRLR